MKVDKDALIKHRFWIMVGLSVPFALLAILFLVTTVSGMIADAQKKLKASLDSAKQGGIRNPDEIQKKKVEADALVAMETTAWNKNFLTQEALLRWPRKMEATYHFADGLFANELRLLKLPADKAEIPKDKAPELIHGTLLSADDAKFEILGTDGKTRYTFFVTPRLKKDQISDERTEKKPLEFGSLRLQNAKEMLLAVGAQRARYFNDRLTSNEQIDYQKTYLSQIPPILRMVDPVHVETGDDGKQYLAGVVQLRTAGSWMFDAAADRDYDEIPAKVRPRLIPPAGSKFLRFVEKEWNIDNDISDEAWIAQEDLWIQKEIYRLVRAANDSLSTFDEVARDDKSKTVTYRNPYFQIKVQLKDPAKLEVTIANLLNRRQKIEAMKLRVRFTKGEQAEPEILSLVTETRYADPLEPRGDPKKTDARVIPIALKAGTKRDGLFGLEQVLTWETAAVKRIDQISIGAAGADEIAQSQKNMALSLRPYKEQKVEEAAADPKGGAQGGPQGGPVGMGGKAGGPGGAGRDGAAAGKLLANGLAPDRYQEVTPQFRRVPIAVVLIVDQNQVDRVQTAFNNSKLRFLMSQVLLNHYPRSVRPDLPEKAGDGNAGAGKPPMGPGGAGPGAFRPPMAGGSGAGAGAFRPPMGGGGPMGLAPMGPGNGPNTAETTDDLEANMELVMYGVVTLYERYPPLPAQAAPPTEAAKAP